jgi:hypothetical protein
MVKRVSLSQVPPKRGLSAVNKKVTEEFNKLRLSLESNKLGPFEAEMVILDDLPAGKPNKKNATIKLLALTKAYIKTKRLPYRAFSRTEAGQSAIYVAAS